MPRGGRPNQPPSSGLVSESAVFLALTLEVEELFMSCKGEGVPLARLTTIAAELARDQAHKQA